MCADNHFWLNYNVLIQPQQILILSGLSRLYLALPNNLIVSGVSNSNY